MKQSDSIKQLCVALVKFHSSVGKIKKSATNPFFKSKYADLSSILDVIEEPLCESGLSFVQFPIGENELQTTLMHESGEWMSGSYTMKPSKNDPQGLGSAITYQRRYALGAILGLNIDEDDDGNAASKPNKNTSKANDKPWLNPNTTQWTDCVAALKGDWTIDDIKGKYKISKANETKLLSDAK